MSAAGKSFGTQSPPLSASGQDQPMGVSGISGNHPSAVPDEQQRGEYFQGSKTETNTASKVQQHTEPHFSRFALAQKRIRQSSFATYLPSNLSPQSTLTIVPRPTSVKRRPWPPRFKFLQSTAIGDCPRLCPFRQPPSLLSRLASAESSTAPDTYWTSSPSPPPSAPPETPRRPLGRPSLLEALAGEPSDQSTPSTTANTLATGNPASAAVVNSPLASSGSNLFDVFSETLSKTFKSSQLHPVASQPSASTAPTSFYFHGDLKNMSANAAGPSSPSKVPVRNTTPSASSSTSAPNQSDAMQVDASPQTMANSSLASSRIPAEIKRHYTEHVELLTIRQTHQRVVDLHEELQGRHQDTMHAFEREKEQMQKLITVSAELFEKAGLLIARQEERWRDEEQDLQAREQQEQEAQRLAAETEARAAEQRVREERERERQEKQRQKEAEEDARRQEEERRREEIERQRAETAKKQQEEAQRLADEKAREEAMEKERQAAEAAVRQAEQERVAKEARLRMLEEADRLALEAMRREEAAATQAQAAHATALSTNQAGVRAKAAAQPSIKPTSESSSATTSSLPPDGLHLGEPTWTVGPSNTPRSAQPSVGNSASTSSAGIARTPSQTDVKPSVSSTLVYPDETITQLFQTTAERERKLAEDLRKGKGSKSPTAPSSAASSSPIVSSNNHGAAQRLNGKPLKASQPPNNASAASPVSAVPSQRTVSRQSVASASTVTSTSQPPTASKPAKVRKQKAPTVVLIKPEPVGSPVMSPIASKASPIPPSSAPVNVARPQDASRAPPPNGLPPKPIITTSGPRKNTSSKSPDQVRFSGNGDRSASSSIPAVNTPSNGRSAGGGTAQTTGKAVEQASRKHVPATEGNHEPPPRQRVVPRDHDDGWITTERAPVGYTAPRSPTPEQTKYIPPSNLRRVPSPAYRNVVRDAPPHRRTPSPRPRRSPLRKRPREDDVDPPPPARRPRYSDTNVPVHSPPEHRAPLADGRSQFRDPSPSRDRAYVSPTRGRSRSPRSHPGPSRRHSPPPPPPARNTYRPDSPSIDTQTGRYTDNPPRPNVYRPQQFSPPSPAPPSVPLSQRVSNARQPAPSSPESRDDRPALLSRMTDSAPPSSAPRGIPNSSPSGSSPQTSRRGRARAQQAPRSQQAAPKRGRGGGSSRFLDRMSDNNPKLSLESRIG